MDVIGLKKTAIIGSGGFGREIIELILSINKEKKLYDLIGFFDDNKKKGELINGYPILGKISEINKIDYKLNIVIAIGDPKIKKSIITKIRNSKIDFPILIHPSVLIGDNDIKIGRGTLICANCIITCNISIEKFVTLNLSCTVGHDSIIKEYSSLMPAVNISGEVLIENQVYVGTGAKIINKLTIGEKATIGAGAVVSKSLPPNCTAVGVPAKVIKINREKEV